MIPVDQLGVDCAVPLEAIVCQTLECRLDTDFPKDAERASAVFLAERLDRITKGVDILPVDRAHLLGHGCSGLAARPKARVCDDGGMADIVSPERRSRMMAGIRGRDTLPELRLRSQLFAAGYRFRLHRRDLPGRPDIVLPGRRVAIQVHGCYWHRHTGCRLTTTPSSNAPFWQAKFEANMARDRRDVAALLALGWRAAVVWECAIGAAGLPADRFDRLREWLDQAATGSDAVDDLLVIP